MVMVSQYAVVGTAMDPYENPPYEKKKSQVYLFSPFFPKVWIVEGDVVPRARGGECGFGEGGSLDTRIDSDNLSSSLEDLVNVFLAKLICCCFVVHDGTVGALKKE